MSVDPSNPVDSVRIFLEHSVSSLLDLYNPLLLFMGCLLVAVTAWQRFNEPSFPDRKTLPQALEPLRYLFLGPAYQRARFAYLIIMLLLYCILVWAGPSIFPGLVRDAKQPPPPPGPWTRAPGP